MLRTSEAGSVEKCFKVEGFVFSPCGVAPMAGAIVLGPKDGGPNGGNRLGNELRASGSVFNRCCAIEFDNCCVANDSEIGAGSEGETDCILVPGARPASRIGELPK